MFVRLVVKKLKIVQPKKRSTVNVMCRGGFHLEKRQATCCLGVRYS